MSRAAALLWRPARPWARSSAPCSGSDHPSVARVVEAELRHPYALFLDRAADDLRARGLGELIGFLPGDHHRESHAHVEGLIHLLVRDVPELLQHLEDRLRLDRVVYLEPSALLQPEQVPESAPW